MQLSSLRVLRWVGGQACPLIIVHLVVSHVGHADHATVEELWRGALRHSHLEKEFQLPLSLIENIRKAIVTFGDGEIVRADDLVIAAVVRGPLVCHQQLGHRDASVDDVLSLVTSIILALSEIDSVIARLRLEIRDERFLDSLTWNSHISSARWGLDVARCSSILIADQ